MNAVMMLFQPRLSARERDGHMFFNFYLAPMKADMSRSDAGLYPFMENARLLGLLRIEEMQAGISPEPVQGGIHTVADDLMARKVGILLSRF
jgi:hypothetical protein